MLRALMVFDFNINKYHVQVKFKTNVVGRYIAKGGTTVRIGAS